MSASMDAITHRHHGTVRQTPSFVDLLLGPVVITLALLVSLFVAPVARAQTIGGAAVDYGYQRTMANIVSGSAAGLQISRGATMNILNGGRIVGTIALNEKRLIDIATMAKIARAATVPGIIAIGATELLNYGLQKCADGTWCRPASAPADGVWKWKGGVAGSLPFDTPEAACADVVPRWAAQNGLSGITLKSVVSSPPSYICYMNGTGSYTSVSQTQTCKTGFVLQGGTCVAAPDNVVPATDTDVETAWKGAFQAKPYLMVNSFGFEDQTTQNQQWADALAQLADVIAPASVSVAEPATSTTTAGQTTKVQRTCTYTGTANPDAATRKDQPLSVGTTCVTTTTNPDGSTTTKTETTDAAPKGAAAAPAKVDVETCGLPGKPACKIDETGTKAQTDVDQAEAAANAKVEQAKTANASVLTGQMSDIEAKHQQATAHWVKLFNVLPTFGSETCSPVQIVDGTAHQTVSLDICPYYLMAKDVFSVFVALGFLLSTGFMVRDAAAV